MTMTKLRVPPPRPARRPRHERREKQPNPARHRHEAPHQGGRPVVPRADEDSNNNVADTREERPEQRHAMGDRCRSRGRVELLVCGRPENQDARVSNPKQVVRRVDYRIVETVALASENQCRARRHEPEVSRRRGDGRFAHGHVEPRRGRAPFEGEGARRHCICRLYFVLSAGQRLWLWLVRLSLIRSRSVLCI